MWEYKNADTRDWKVPQSNNTLLKRLNQCLFPEVDPSYAKWSLFKSQLSHRRRRRWGRRRTGPSTFVSGGAPMLNNLLVPHHFLGQLQYFGSQKYVLTLPIGLHISPFFYLRLRGTRIAVLRIKLYLSTLVTEHYTVNDITNQISILLGLESNKLFEMSLKKNRR